jgi:hypothetical protein
VVERVFAGAGLGVAINGERSRDRRQLRKHGNGFDAGTWNGEVNLIGFNREIGVENGLAQTARTAVSGVADGVDRCMHRVTWQHGQ